MQNITSEKVQELRKKTGVGMMDCKQALVESSGNFDKAVDILREKGKSKAVKKSVRDSSEGILSSYIHMGNKLGVLVELNCETDFVARTDEFNLLGREIAMHIAASNPLWIKTEEVPQEIIDKEKLIYKAQIVKEGKPANVADKIVEGKIKKYLTEVCLLEQAFVKKNEISVKELVEQYISKLGENITIKRFVRFSVGEE